MKYDDFKRLHQLVDGHKRPGEVVMFFGKFYGCTIAEVYQHQLYWRWYLQPAHREWKKVSVPEFSGC